MDKSLGSNVKDWMPPFVHGYDYHCQPCSVRGEFYQAKGYCVDCEEYLCKECYKVHRITELQIRHHTMLDRDSVECALPTLLDTLKDDCHIHRGRPLQYHCPAHDTLICGHCVARAHKHCQDIQSTTDLSEYILDSEEYKTLSRNIDCLCLKCKEILSVSNANMTKRKENDKQILQDLRQLRKEVNAELDRLENKVKSQLVDINGSETSKLMSVTSQTIEVLNMVQQMHDQFERLQKSGKHRQLYAVMKKTSKLLPHLEERVKLANNQNSTPVFRFQPCRNIKTSISTFESLGDLCLETTKEIRGEHVNDMLVRVHDDKKDCLITGALATDNRLILADNSNAKVKVFNTVNKTLITQICLMNPPWAITNVSDSQFIVTLPKAGQLMFLQLWKDKLKSQGVLDVEGNCYGICHKNSRLFVTFTEPGQVKILDLRGNVLSVFETNEMGQRLFNKPKHMCVSDFSLPAKLYVSDPSNATLTCLTQEGNVHAVYEDDKNNGPWKLVVDADGKSHGTVYACGCNHHNIHLIAANCERVKVLLYQRGNLNYMTILFYHESTQTLFLQENFSNIIKLYHITDSWHQSSTLRRKQLPGFPQTRMGAC